MTKKCLLVIFPYLFLCLLSSSTESQEEDHNVTQERECPEDYDYQTKIKNKKGCVPKINSLGETLMDKLFPENSHYRGRGKKAGYIPQGGSYRNSRKYKKDKRLILQEGLSKFRPMVPTRSEKKKKKTVVTRDLDYPPRETECPPGPPVSEGSAPAREGCVPQLNRRGKNLMSQIFPENSDYAAGPRHVGLRPDEDSNEINLSYYYDSNEDLYTGNDYMNHRIKHREKGQKNDPSVKPKTHKKKHVKQVPSKSKLESRKSGNGISISEV